MLLRNSFHWRLQTTQLNSFHLKTEVAGNHITHAPAEFLSLITSEPAKKKHISTHALTAMHFLTGKSPLDPQTSWLFQAEHRGADLIKHYWESTEGSLLKLTVPKIQGVGPAEHQFTSSWISVLRLGTEKPKKMVPAAKPTKILPKRAYLTTGEWLFIKALP